MSARLIICLMIPFATGFTVLIPGCLEADQGPVISADVTADSAPVDTVTELDVVGADVPQDVVADVSADAVTPPDTAPPQAGCDNIVTLMEQQLVSVVGGSSEELAIYVPEGAVSIAISVIGSVEESNLHSIGSWVNPGGVLVADGWGDNPQNGGQLCLNCSLRVMAAQGAVAAIAPNNPQGVFEAGEHRFRVTAATPPTGFFGGSPTPTDDEVMVTVTAKVVEAGLPDVGVLNLNLHFTGAQGWTAETAPAHPDVQAMLGKVGDIYAQVGITLGDITYTDVGEEFAVIEDFDGPNADLARMFATSEVHDNHHLNLFFVDELLGPFGGSGFGVVLGISGGIPGPPLLHGTPRSGVAIAIKPVPMAPAAADTTMAHEMGHFLGLFHTIEANPFGFGPTINDPLPDTPATDDKSWLMHNEGAGDQMSEWQGIVMRSNPWVCN